MSLGPLMIDLEAYEISTQEREWLMHQSVGGVILFTRNFESYRQIKDLVTEIHALRSPHLIVAVDHEGGTIQRFRQDFTSLPSAAALGELYDKDRQKGLESSKTVGWLMAAELREVGIDISFAPVLDLASRENKFIGSRAFHKSPEVVAEIAHEYMLGMRDAGMMATGKHFPGHGKVKGDTHITKPIDQRSFEDLMMQDILPFERMIHYGLAAIMPSHVVYEKVDRLPAGFSKTWMQDILRIKLGFQGCIFSDDLSMDAADLSNSYMDRAKLALQAGCDMVLVCNNPSAVSEVIDPLQNYNNPASQIRLARMHGKAKPELKDLKKTQQWSEAQRLTIALADSPELEMNI